MVLEEDLILVHPPHKIIKYKVTERCLSCTSIKTAEFTVTYDLEDRKIIDQVGSGLASEYGYMTVEFEIQLLEYGDWLSYIYFYIHLETKNEVFTMDRIELTPTTTKSMKTLTLSEEGYMIYPSVYVSTFGTVES